MLYPYQCTKCKNKEDLEYQITDNLPQEVECPKCKNIMKRVWESSNVVVPEHMRAGNETPWKYDKSPSGRKHFY